MDWVVIRFAGDSGDGMQLTGDQFTAAETARFGNDLATLPSFSWILCQRSGLICSRTLPGRGGLTVAQQGRGPALRPGPCREPMLLGRIVDSSRKPWKFTGV